MTDRPLKEQGPNAQRLEREARRLARIRHLAVVREAPSELPTPTPVGPRDSDPDPKAAA